MSHLRLLSSRVACFSGLICTLVTLAGLIGCEGKSGGTAQKSGKFSVEGGAAKDDTAQVAVQEGDAEEAPSGGLFKSKKAAGGDTPPKPPVVSSEKLGDFKVPEEPEEIHAFLISLSSRQPRGRTPEEQRADFLKIQKSAISAAEKLLAAKEATKAMRLDAVYAKLGSLNALIQREIPEAAAQRDTFITSLAKDKDSDVARVGRMMLFDSESMSLAEKVESEKADPKPLVERLKKFIAAEEKDVDTFNVAKRTAEALEQLGQEEESIQACRIIGEAFAGNENKDLSRAGQSLLDQALITEVGLLEKLQAALADKPKSQEPLMAAIQKILSAKTLGATAFEQTSQAANIMEFTGHYKQSSKILELVGKAFKDHPEEKIAQVAAEAVANGAKRLGLVGKPFIVEGDLIDGSKFDWSKYEGKVVLLDFWATWCTPCLKEIPNIKQNYEKYKDKGFEVVGINCDDDKMAVERFFAQQELPWETIHSTDPEALGMNNPLAKKCGVDAIPFLVLINAQGKVEAIHVHGKGLSEKLAAIFDGAKPGDAPSSETPEKPAAETGRKGPPPKKPVDTKSSGLSPLNSGEHFIMLVDEEAKAEEEVNPYLADAGLAPEELAAFILKMQNKPKSIQKRPGFGDAIVEAANRILAAEAKDKQQFIAIEAKLESLHKRACLGDEKCDKDLVGFVDSLKADARDRVAREVKFFQLERQVIEADKLPLDKLPELLAQVKEYFTKEKLSAKHLRIASSTVALINRLEDGDGREKEFKEVGAILAKSSDKELARYGKKLAKAPGESESKLVGQPLELEGNTSEGQPFKWEAYRGKVVLVDFWATWCGPCRKEMPHVKELYEKHKDKGFDVVGVSLDKDLDALEDYLKEHSIPWTTLAGEETQGLAEKYSVRGIPTMMLIDKDGKIVAVSHSVGGLSAKLEALLAPAAK